MIRAVVIDDEEKSRETLIELLKRYCKEVHIIAQADGCSSGITIIEKHKPDLVFLDIQMPDGSGFKLLESLERKDFVVIFTTAYDQFAIKAIRYSALDYLLKPIIPEELVNAVNKASQHIKQGSIDRSIKTLLENIREQEPRNIVLSTSQGLHVVNLSDVVRCESDDYYTRLFFADGHHLMVSKTLKEIEEMIDSPNFIRVHKSHLVNTKYIKCYLKMDGGSLLLFDETKIPVSRRKREFVIASINTPNLSKR